MMVSEILVSRRFSQTNHHYGLILKYFFDQGVCVKT
jgi:hypothetical protein